MARAIRVKSISGALTVTVTGSAGGTPTVYTDDTFATTVTLPATVTSGATLNMCFRSPDTYALSVKANGVEIAGDNNTTRPVDLESSSTLAAYAYDARLTSPIAGSSGPEGLLANLNGSYSTLAARFLALATLDLSAAVPPVTEAPPTIAYSSSSSPLAVENLVQGGPFTVTGSQAFTYTTAEGGGTAGYVAPTVVGNEIAPYLLAFDTDASTIDVRYVGSASPTYRMLVDGEAVTPFAQVAGGGGSGAKWRINVVFPNNRMRRVVIESTTLFVRSVYTAATDTILPAPKPALSLALLGDSYIAQQNVDGIPLVACRALGVAPIINGSGGTGYLNSQGGANGKQVYGDRLAGLLAANPSALVVFGGINDTAGAPLQAACSAVIVAARAAQPRMPVVIVGSQNPPSQAGAGVGKAANLQAAAAASGAFFVDMTTGNLYDTAGTLLAAGSAWITGTGHVGGTTGDGNADIYIGSDTTHPYTTTDTTVRDGWVYHGLRLAAALQTVLTVGV